MARPSKHSATEVEKIAKTLQAARVPVTPYRVQQRLGGASFGWVRKTLDELGFGPDDALPEGLDPTTAQLLRLVQPLADDLEAAADAKIAEAERRHQDALEAKTTQLHAAQQERDRATDDAAALNARLGATEQANAALQQELEATQKRLETANAELQALQALTKGFDAQVADAKAAVQRERELLADFREQSRQQMRAMKDREQQELALMQQQIEALDARNIQLDDRLREKADEAVVLNRQNAELVAEIKQLQAADRDRRQQIAELQSAIAARDLAHEKAMERAAQARDRWRDEASRLEGLNTSLKDQVAELQHQCASLQARLEKAGQRPKTDRD